jgi:hypothetical protein
LTNFEAELASVSKKLDQIEAEIVMNQEAIESIEIRLRLLKTELDFEINKNDIID